MDAFSPDTGLDSSPHHSEQTEQIARVTVRVYGVFCFDFSKIFHPRYIYLFRFVSGSRMALGT